MVEKETETYSYAQIAEALNRAADDIAEAAGIGDGPVSDGMSLLLNVGLVYLRREADTVRDAIEIAYEALSDHLEDGENLAEHVIGWISEN